MLCRVKHLEQDRQVVGIGPFEQDCVEGSRGDSGWWVVNSGGRDCIACVATRG